MRAAEKLHISYEIIHDTDCLKLEKGGVEHFFRSRTPPTTNAFAFRVCQNKASTKSFLRRSNINSPRGFYITKTDTSRTWKEVWNALEKPVVFKPTHGTHGRQIVVGVKEWDECCSLLEKYFLNPEFEGGVLLEEMFLGSECRIIANKRKVIAAMKRDPANVVGNGSSSIEELIKVKNLLPIRNISQDLYPHISIDLDLEENLRKQNLSTSSIPKNGEKIILRTVSNIMAGGDAIDITDSIHESVKEIALRTIRAIPGLSWVGIDFMSTDLESAQNSSSYSIIELGALPEFAMHDIPMYGKPRDVAKEFICLMFPEATQ